MPLSLETPSVYKLILGYLWSILFVFAVLYIFNLHFAYDGDLMFWLIAAYVAPAGFVIEAIDQGFSIGLAAYTVPLAGVTAWSIRRAKTTE